jgi:hypothetical protein
MKKGDITISTVVYTILILVGFLMILGVFYLIYNSLSWNGMVDKTTCQQSVNMRSSSILGAAGAKELVQLKCKTQKTCVTSGIIGGSCKDFEGLKGVAKAKVKTKEDIEKTIAGSIIDCWDMMGKGEKNLFSQWVAETYGFGSVYPTCIICNRIAFDSIGLKKAGINLNEINVMNYMMTRKIPSKEISYYSYIAGGEGKVSVKDNVEIQNLQFDSEGNFVDSEKINVSLGSESGSVSGNADDKELAVLFMQISAPKHSGVIKNTALTLLGGYGATRILAPKFVGKGATALIKSPWAWIALAIAGVYQQYSVSENRALTASFCGDVSVGEDAREGCSVVRTVDYNLEDISKYCSVIESIP